jgi:hypothetical protein
VRKEPRHGSHIETMQNDSAAEKNSISGILFSSSPQPTPPHSTLPNLVYAVRRRGRRELVEKECSLACSKQRANCVCLEPVESKCRTIGQSELRFPLWDTRLRHYATSRKVAGSTPVEILLFSVCPILLAAVWTWGQPNL